MNKTLLAFSFILCACQEEPPRLKQLETHFGFDQNLNEAYVTVIVDNHKLYSELWICDFLMSYTFFSITVPCKQAAIEWAAQNWETYGFDYNEANCVDLRDFGKGIVCAWALEDDLALRNALMEDGIEFTNFEVEDLDKFFEL